MLYYQIFLTRGRAKEAEIKKALSEFLSSDI